ncbi:MAG: hypothetical protein J5769_03110 [Bacteroidales bacterium]|nr:hypothetical protein [Bacteroidales bacterium]
MKRIEDIINKDYEELEEASREVDVPEGLQQRLMEAIAAHEATRVEPKIADRRLIRWLPYSAAAAAAVAAVFIGLNLTGRPKDTFDDPYLAYAQVEAAFRTISDKMSVGVEYAVEARELSEKPASIMNKIQGK